MSSARRSGGEDNILAMLERDSTSGLGGRLAPGTRVLGYGGAALLVLGLIGALVWLASDDHLTIVTPVPAFGPEPAHQSRSPDAHETVGVDVAVIVDEPGDMERQAPTALPSHEPDVPPLVLLSEGKETPTAAAATRQAKAAAPAAEPMAGTDASTVQRAAHPGGTPTPTGASAAAPKPASIVDSEARMPASTAAMAAATPTAAKAARIVDTAPPAHPKELAAAKSAERTAARPAAVPSAPPASTREPVRTADASRDRAGERRAATRAQAGQKEKARPAAAARTASRTAPPARGRKGQAGPSEARAEGVDSDVALISAIIMHSSAHAAERRRAAAASCTDNCDTKDDARPAK
jgi:hypothetical protein